MRASDASGEGQGPVHQHGAGLAPSIYRLFLRDQSGELLLGYSVCLSLYTHRGDDICAHCYSKDCDARL